MCAPVERLNKWGESLNEIKRKIKKPTEHSTSASARENLVTMFYDFTLKKVTLHLVYPHPFHSPGTHLMPPQTYVLIVPYCIFIFNLWNKENNSILKIICSDVQNFKQKCVGGGSKIAIDPLSLYFICNNNVRCKITPISLLLFIEFA